MKPIKIKWVLVHEPIELFIRAAEKFVEEIEKRAPGKFDVEVMNLSEYTERYHSDISLETANRISKHEILGHMDEGKLEMSQMYTYVLSKYNHDLHALDIPFMFRDHDHAAKVFEGPIGESLLDGYTKNSNIKGLAFTYSGGFINIPVGKEVSSIKDLVGTKIRVSNSPVCSATWAALGAEPVIMDVEAVADGIRDGAIEAGESSWPRIYGCNQSGVTETILEPDHRLLMTNIIINNDFFNSLAPELQTALKEAAIIAGRYERELSINDVPNVKARCAQEGISIVKLSEEDRKTMAEVGEKVYQQFADSFTPGIVEGIKSLH